MKIKLFIAIMILISSAVCIPAKAEAGADPAFSLSEYSLFERYFAQPSDQVKLAKYVSLLAPLMRDRTQTLQLDSRGFSENNSLLGRHPSNTKINGYFLAYALSLLASFHLPEPFASSLLDTIRYQEEIVTSENERLFNREAVVTSAPIAFMFTISY